MYMWMGDFSSLLIYRDDSLGLLHCLSQGLALRKNIFFKFPDTITTSVKWLKYSKIIQHRNTWDQN